MTWPSFSFGTLPLTSTALTRAYRAGRICLAYTEVPGLYEVRGITYPLRWELNHIGALFDGRHWLVDEEQRRIIEGIA